MTASFYYWKAFPQPKKNVFMQSKKIPTRKRDVLKETEGHYIFGEGEQSNVLKGANKLYGT